MLEGNLEHGSGSEVRSYQYVIFAGRVSSSEIQPTESVRSPQAPSFGATESSHCALVTRTSLCFELTISQAFYKRFGTEHKNQGTVACDAPSRITRPAEERCSCVYGSVVAPSSASHRHGRRAWVATLGVLDKTKSYCTLHACAASQLFRMMKY